MHQQNALASQPRLTKIEISPAPDCAVTALDAGPVPPSEGKLTARYRSDLKKDWEITVQCHLCRFMRACFDSRARSWEERILCGLED